MTYKIIIFIFFVILIIIINYNILEKLQIKEGFDVDFGRMNIVLGEAGILIKDAEITADNKIKFTLSNGTTLETKKSIKGTIGDPGDDAIYITGKRIDQGNLTFTFSDGTEKLIGRIKGESIAAGTTALEGDRGERSLRIPKKFNIQDTEKTGVQNDGKIKLVLEDADYYLPSTESTKGNKGTFPQNIDPSSITKITPKKKIEAVDTYKERTCQLWLKNNDIKPIHDFFIGFIGTDNTEITFTSIDDVIIHSKLDDSFFKMKHNDPKIEHELNGKFTDIVNYIVLVDDNNNLKSKIKNINFKINNLSGVLPKNLNKFINVTSLQLQHNNLSGTIPREFGDLVNLIEFDISSNNNITGLIPNTFVNLTKLEKINTKVTGLINKHKVEFDNLNNTQQFLKTLDELSYNGVKLGKGLLTLFRGINADYFNGNSNEIKSNLNLNKELIELGLELTEAPRLMFKNKVFSWNDLKQENLIAIFSRIQMKYFHNDNEPNGYFSPVYESSILTNVFAPYMGAFRNMPIEGNIASLFGVIDEHNLNQKIKFINMTHNNLGGSIPDSITTLTNLTYLNLSHNQDITGQLPEIGQITNLKFLLLNNTGISGVLPLSLKDLQNLVMINTKDTSLHYTYQKVKIPESYSYQEITEYNDLSSQKAEIKDFLKLISYTNYDECKNNVINCVNESNINIKISDSSTEDFVILSDTNQVSITDLQGTVINGEWIKIIRSNLNVFVESAPEIQSTINFETDGSNDGGNYDWVYQFLNNTTYNSMKKHNYKLYNSNVEFTSPKISAKGFGGPNLYEKIFKRSCQKNPHKVTGETCHGGGFWKGPEVSCSFDGGGTIYKTNTLSLDYKFIFNGNYIFKTIPERFENYYYFKPDNKISSVINLNTLKNKKIYILADSQTNIKVNESVLDSSQSDDVKIKLNIDFDDLNNFYQKKNNVWGQQNSYGTGFCGSESNFPSWRNNNVGSSNINDVFKREISLDNTAISKLKEKTKTALEVKEKTLKIYKI